MAADQGQGQLVDFPEQAFAATMFLDPGTDIRA
jgi:hypothetical protein